MNHDRRRVNRLRRRLTLSHDGRPFLDRWGVVHERVGGVYLHHIADRDPGMDLHDHPFAFITIILRGGYVEEAKQVEWRATATDEFARRYTPAAFSSGAFRWHRRFHIHRMPLGIAHRITSTQPGTWTLVLRGPTRRRWGFYVNGGWIDWEQYPYETRRPSTVPRDSSGVYK